MIIFDIIFLYFVLFITDFYLVKNPANFVAFFAVKRIAVSFNYICRFFKILLNTKFIFLCWFYSLMPLLHLLLKSKILTALPAGFKSLNRQQSWSYKYSL